VGVRSALLTGYAGALADKTALGGPWAHEGALAKQLGGHDLVADGVAKREVGRLVHTQDLELFRPG